MAHTTTSQCIHHSVTARNWLFNASELRVAHPSPVTHIVLLSPTDLLSEHQESSTKTKRGSAGKEEGVTCLAAPEALKYSLLMISFYMPDPWLSLFS